jgi:hypothetical protein
MDEEIKQIIEDIFNIDMYFETNVANWIIKLAEKIRSEGYKKSA